MLLRQLVDAATTLGVVTAGARPPRIVATSGAGAPAGPDELDAVEVTSVVHDTTEVAAGALFCCVRGARVDGHDLAPVAVQAGAAAVLVDHELDLSGVTGPAGRQATVPQVVVPDVRAAMGPFAAAFWGEPSRDLSVIGVTGTAGKTTVTHLLRSVLDAAGRSCAVIGTLSDARTTPEAPKLQARLAAERDAKRGAVAMEVSSHGLELHRVDATWFSAAIFTNLSRDHLDFHQSMDAYFASKERLFTPAFTDRVVICADDSWGRKLLAKVEADSALQVDAYSVADAQDLELTPAGARFTWQGVRMTVALTGRFNVANAVAVATTARALDVPLDVIAAGLEAAEPAPGRFEQVDAGQPFTVVVDYAHKPEALEQALLAGRDLAGGSGELTVVLGCGGDRDSGKRPLMGAVAGRLADRVVVTSDNPRSEDPMAIIAQVRQGLPPGARVAVEPDRRQAIAVAVAEAGPGDVVLLAGKGHETTQTVGDRVLPFDDRRVARDLLGQAGWTKQADGGRGRSTTPGPAGDAGEVDGDPA